MPKNICIFSDGTGQAGGANPIHWTNIYRLFMATRQVDPGAQICFYDPGLGANPDAGEQRSLFRRFKDMLAQATGYGITDNIIDCYAALLVSHEPGDPIFLFGFSRGAYTVRSLGGVLGLCGVPTGLPKVAHWDDFADAIVDPVVRKLATQAVSEVYMIKDDTDRARAAEAFRQEHGTSPNPPFFVGVWDTVRALGLPAIGSMPGAAQIPRSRPQPPRRPWPAGPGDRREPRGLRARTLGRDASAARPDQAALVRRRAYRYRRRLWPADGAVRPDPVLDDRRGPRDRTSAQGRTRPARRTQARSAGPAA
jgi:hypothetical protein